MKRFAWLFSTVGICLIFSFTGCTTAPPSGRPSSSGIIYDESGNPIYIPPSKRRPHHPPDETHASSQHEYGDYPSDTQVEAGRQAKKIPETVEQETPRIGAETTPQPDGETYLVAAVSPLAEQAQKQIRSGDLNSAHATVERAIRIDSTNPELWNMMAEIQFKKGNFRQAEQVARKSNLLARGDRKMQTENWYIIAAALKKLGEIDASNQALSKARALENM